MLTPGRLLSSLSLPLLLAAAGASVPACSGDPSMSPGGADEDDGADGADGADDDSADGDDKDDSQGDGDAGDAGDGGDQGGDGVDGAPGGPDGQPGTPDAAVIVDAGPPPPEGPYAFLSESGLYSDIASHTLAADVMEFEPEFKLWSDAAEKRRWIRLPAGTQINSSLMDRWRFPNGTTVWKEFSDPVTGKRLETRIIQRLSTGEFYFASFLWNANDTEAAYDPTLFPAPAVDIPAGCSECASPPCTSFPADCHVVPQSNKCNECHGGEVGRLLGFSAVQLSHEGAGLTLSDLVELDLLSVPPAGGETFPVPGTPVERDAIGYLHANCGHCHSPQSGQTGCNSLTGLQMRVVPADATVEDTQVFATGVDQPLAYWINPMRGNHTEEQLGELMTERILPGDASRSAIWYRMSVREFGQLAPNNDHQQMPYFFTNEVDEEGLAAVELWIDSLP